MLLHEIGQAFGVPDDLQAVRGAEGCHRCNVAIAEALDPGRFIAKRVLQGGPAPSESLRQARLLEPALPDTYLALAKLYRAQSRFDDARAIYQAGLAVAPTDGPLLVAYADFLFDRGEQEQAKQLLAQADQVAPTVAMLLARAQVYGRLAQNSDALADLQAARQKEPGSLDVLLALGDLYRAMGDNVNAQKAYADASKLSPGIAAGRVRLARVAQ